MQITVCDVCEPAPKGIRNYIIPLSGGRNPDTVSLDLCRSCINALLNELVLDQNKAASALNAWIRKVRGR